jgi:hypothetical protein
MKSEFHFIEDRSLLLHCMHIKLSVDIHGVLIYFVVHHVLYVQNGEIFVIMSALLILEMYVCACVCVFAFVLKHHKRACPCQDLIHNSI